MARGREGTIPHESWPTLFNVTSVDPFLFLWLDLLMEKCLDVFNQVKIFTFFFYFNIKVIIRIEAIYIKEYYLVCSLKLSMRKNNTKFYNLVVICIIFYFFFKVEKVVISFRKNYQIKWDNGDTDSEKSHIS